jgi:hypothetical protein
LIKALPSTPPTPELLDTRQANDIVISRTGWTAQDNVLALRSGGPGNHEHADRNSVIFKAYGERLLHDPFRAAYMVHPAALDAPPDRARTPPCSSTARATNITTAARARTPRGPLRPRRLPHRPRLDDA